MRVMNETTDAGTKSQYRQRAAQRAAEVDKDYARAIQLCLDVSEDEHSYLPFWIEANLDEQALMYAKEGIRDAVAKKDNLEVERLLNLLPGRLKSTSELELVRQLARRDTRRALLLLDQARRTLEQEIPTRADTYGLMLDETANLEPGNLNLSWTVLVNGLNRFSDAQKAKAQKTGPFQEEAVRGKLLSDPLNPWFLSEPALEDENFVRACIGDLDSPEYRARLRLGVIGRYLASYSDAVKKTLPKSKSNGGSN